MVLPLYLAMTDWEILSAEGLPTHMAYMACHFSSYGLGLEELPESLPKGGMLILNDRIPVWDHDPELVATQLKQYTEAVSCDGVLLDFQRTGCHRTAAIIDAVCQALACPVGVPEPYAQDRDCPVFLPPVPHHRSLQAHIAPWNNHEIWLDAAMDAEIITVTGAGSVFTPLPRHIPEGICHRDSNLHCSYQMQVFSDRAEFTLFRTQEDLADLLQQAEDLGITRAIGLYQEHRK